MPRGIKSRTKAHVDLLLLTFSDLILAWLRDFAALLRERVEALAVVDLSVEAGRSQGLGYGFQGA